MRTSTTASGAIVATVMMIFAGVMWAYPEPPLVDGLSWTYYKKSCPKLESIVKKKMESYLDDDITQAAGIIRLHFHDCFVQGCDGSVLLVGNNSEQTATPNRTLRQKALDIVNDIKAAVDQACGVTVSCADITTLAARDSVRLTGGPSYRVPLGRRDSRTFASVNVTVANLPPPTFNVTQLINIFAKHSLNTTDMVALSGAHTFGRAHCPSFANRLRPTVDSTMNQYFVEKLKLICPTNTSSNFTNLDVRTANVFDNKYYVNLQNKQGLLFSDQDLYTDSRTKQIVKDFALDQELFFAKFSYAMDKMSQISVLTGTEGEIRSNCSVPNSSSEQHSSIELGSVVEDMVESSISAAISSL